MRAWVASASALSANGRARHTAFHTAANPRSGTWHARPCRLSNQLRGGCHIYPSRGPLQPLCRRSLRPARAAARAAVSSQPRVPSVPRSLRGHALHDLALLRPRSLGRALLRLRSSLQDAPLAAHSTAAVTSVPCSSRRSPFSALRRLRSPHREAPPAALLTAVLTSVPRSPHRVAALAALLMAALLTAVLTSVPRSPHEDAPLAALLTAALLTAVLTSVPRSPHRVAAAPAALLTAALLTAALTSVPRSPHEDAPLAALLTAALLTAALTSPSRRSDRAPHGCAHLSAAVFVATISSQPSGLTVLWAWSAWRRGDWQSPTSRVGAFEELDKHILKCM
ncbi:uncharacterized protein LOC113885974 [Bos indicus x Bos taurus]|uniref:uncharacterized protein LOC113885974 n=1 Tax=Bos indicus x Bos taurus TaxID=30522 RepID=UPI000F7D1786|nr:uncharacterized protein LOC113885974 [Bos indicus x Bos taurus]